MGHTCSIISIKYRYNSTDSTCLVHLWDYIGQAPRYISVKIWFVILCDSYNQEILNIMEHLVFVFELGIDLNTSDAQK